MPVEKPLVLVADDNDDGRELYEACLTDAGCRVITARNGTEAIALASNRCPDAIVMDLQMPDIDGWEAIRQIRAAQCEPRPYIVVASAHSAERARRDAYDGGADDFVAKPHSPNVLCALIFDGLRGRATRGDTGR